MPKISQNETVSGLLSDLTSTVDVAVNQIEWAEDEIRNATSRQPSDGDLLYHSFPLLRPTHKLMTTEFVYRSHCKELLERLVDDTDTRPGTAAEVCCLCSDMSQIAPFRTPAAGLYFRMWSAAFPDKLIDGKLQHYEALEGSNIDDLEATARRKLAVTDRKLCKVTCSGRHHGETIQCKFVGQ